MLWAEGKYAQLVYERNIVDIIGDRVDIYFMKGI